MEKVNLADKFSLFKDYWSPKIVGEVNDSYVKLAKFKGDFVWHKHDQEDELNSSKKGGNEVKKLEGPLECEIFASKRFLWSVFQCF